MQGSTTSVLVSNSSESKLRQTDRQVKSELLSFSKLRSQAHTNMPLMLEEKNCITATQLNFDLLGSFLSNDDC